ncbi:unnamed protein product [Closterium sp. NIES-65]|nr:unnamed protein product [Closterium sp. NIES-65]
MPDRCLHLCFCADPALLPIAFPPHSSSLADLVSNLPASTLPLALGAASTSQVSGNAELSFPPAHNVCITPLLLPSPSLSLLQITFCLTRLPTSSPGPCADLASVAHFPASRHGSDTKLASAIRPHTSLRGAGADPASVTHFPALRDAADAAPVSATRLPASHCDSSTNPACAIRLPASCCDSSTDLASAIRLPISRCDASLNPANATCFPVSHHDADVAQANATCLPALRYGAGADLARADRFPALRHSAGAGLARAMRGRPAPRRAPAVQKQALPHARFVRCHFRLSPPPRLP